MQAPDLFPVSIEKKIDPALDDFRFRGIYKADIIFMDQRTHLIIPHEPESHILDVAEVFQPVGAELEWDRPAGLFRLFEVVQFDAIKLLDIWKYMDYT